MKSVNNFGFCRACGQQIVFIKTKAGKQMPCNPLIRDFWPKEGGHERIVTPDGNVVAGEFSGDGEPSYGYISHFATCKEANRFRKRNKK